jgi:copper(I)-binding protein
MANSSRKLDHVACDNMSHCLKRFCRANFACGKNDNTFLPRSFLLLRLTMNRLILAFIATLVALPVNAADIKVEDAWVRATAPGQPVGGAFMKLTSNRDARLVGASSPVAGVTQVHMMKMQDGMMIMREIKSLPLPKGRTVELAPGGYHIMLMELKHPLKAGESVPITLRVKTGKRIQNVKVSAAVHDMMDSEEMHHHH